MLLLLLSTKNINRTNDENTGYLTSLKYLTPDKIPNVNDIITKIIATIVHILYINFYI